MIVLLILQACVKEIGGRKDGGNGSGNDVKRVIAHLTIHRPAACSLPDRAELLKPFDLLVFDQQERFVTEYKFSSVGFGPGYDVPVALKPGYYTLVAIGGYDEAQLWGTPFFTCESLLAEGGLKGYLEQNDSLFASPGKLYYGYGGLSVGTDGGSFGEAIEVSPVTKPLNVYAEGLNEDGPYLLAVTENAVIYPFGQHVLFEPGEEVYSRVGPEGAGGKLAAGMLSWPINKQKTRVQIYNQGSGALLLDMNLRDLFRKVPDLNPDCAQELDLRLVYKVGVLTEIRLNDWDVVDSGGGEVY